MMSNAVERALPVNRAAESRIPPEKDTSRNTLHHSCNHFLDFLVSIKNIFADTEKRKDGYFLIRQIICFLSTVRYQRMA